MRNVMQAITNLSTQVNGPGTGQGALEGYGYDGTDASAVLELIAYMNTVAWAYYGLVQADRSGGAGAVDFNDNQALVQRLERAVAPSRR
jgi:hypothetical protein